MLGTLRPGIVSRVELALSPRHRFERHTGAIFAALFFVVGVAVSGDIGITADERETTRAAVRNVEILSAALSGQPIPDWSFHEITGFYFAVDSARGLWLQVAQALGATDTWRAMHLTNLVLASLTLWLLHSLALRAGASRRTAMFAVLALALLPKFVAHSQNNPKDLPGTFAITLAIYAMLKAFETLTARDAIGAGGAFGFALTTRVHSLFTLPIAGLWIAITRDRFERRLVVAGFTTLGVGAIAFVALWPWLWPDPIESVPLAFSKLSSKIFAFPVLYLGEIYSADQVPWHYRTVQFLATMPLLMLALASLGLASLCLPHVARGERQLALLGALWTLTYFAADALVFSRYDVIRHFMVALPGVALLIASGASFALRSARSRGAATAVVALAYASSAWGLVATYPYANAYLNSAARYSCDGDCDRTFEIEYWAQTHLEASRWLLNNASPGSEVIVPLLGHVAAEYLEGTRLEVREGSVREWTAPDRERYLVVISRHAWWTPPIEEVARTHKPVYEIRRSGGQLLAIYSNARPD